MRKQQDKLTGCGRTRVFCARAQHQQFITARVTVRANSVLSDRRVVAEGALRSLVCLFVTQQKKSKRATVVGCSSPGGVIDQQCAPHVFIMAQLMKGLQTGIVLKQSSCKHVSVTEGSNHRQPQQRHTGQRQCQQLQRLAQQQQLLQTVHNRRRHLLFLAAAVPALSTQLSAQAASKQTYSPAFLKAFQQALSTTGSFEVGNAAKASGAQPASV